MRILRWIGFGVAGLVGLALLFLGWVYAASEGHHRSFPAPTPFATQEGTLYPLLSKLRREEHVDYNWVESGQGPPRKYYQLTDKGVTRLDELSAYWRHLTATLEGLGR